MAKAIKKKAASTQDEQDALLKAFVDARLPEVVSTAKKEDSVDYSDLDPERVELALESARVLIHNTVETLVDDALFFFLEQQAQDQEDEDEDDEGDEGDEGDDA